jgi:hypothetical protein
MGRHRLAATLIAASVVGIVAMPARADDLVVKYGKCEGLSRWRLAAERIEDGRLRVVFRIKTGVAGQEWQVYLSDNGERVFAGTRISDDQGIVRVRRLIRDRLGPDEISAAAFNEATGERCAGQLVI